MIRAARAMSRPVLLLAGLVLAGLALRGLGLDSTVASAGEHGPALFVVLAAGACALGVPRQVAAYAGGLAFGFWPGTALALLAMVLGCVLDFGWARLVARDWAARRLRAGGRLARLDAFLSANPFTATLTLRLLPVGNNLALNLLAGVSGVAAVPFVLGSALGFIPQTAVFALLGGGVRVEHGAQVAVAVALFAASAGLGVVLMRRRALPA